MATQEALRVSAPADSVAARPSPAIRRAPRWYIEVAIVGLFYGTYEASRAAVPTHATRALHHAQSLIRLEHSLRIGIERSVNEVLVNHAWLGVTSGYYYATLHFIVTPAVLIWLFVWRPQLYRRARTALVLASFGALIVFFLYPVAPPRFALPGATDILYVHDVFGAAKSGNFINLYAAMPSLHVGWAVWVALSLSRANPGRRWRHLFWLYPAMTTFVVIGTANHYILDAIAGALVVIASWALVQVWTGRVHRKDRVIDITELPSTERADVCELCDFTGPRRYLITFTAMLEANGLHIDPHHPALLGDDLDSPVEVTIPIETVTADSDHALDDVLAEFASWGSDLARITTHEFAA